MKRSRHMTEEKTKQGHDNATRISESLLDLKYTIFFFSFFHYHINSSGAESYDVQLVLWTADFSRQRIYRIE